MEAHRLSKSTYDSVGTVLQELNVSKEVQQDKSNRQSITEMALGGGLPRDSVANQDIPKIVTGEDDEQHNPNVSIIEDYRQQSLTQTESQTPIDVINIEP